jgi:hypothetical protein
MIERWFIETDLVLKQAGTIRDGTGEGGGTSCRSVLGEVLPVWAGASAIHFSLDPNSIWAAPCPN